MVKIRLTRTGRKNAPSYRVVATDSKSPRDGKFIEVIGYYNPSHNPEQFEIDKERYKYWLSVGAQPSKAVTQLVDGKYDHIVYDPKAIEEQKKKEQEEAEKKEQEQSEKQATTEEQENPAEDKKGDTKQDDTKKSDDKEDKSNKDEPKQ